MVGMDQVVAERQGAGLAGDPVAADQEGLGDAVRSRLLGVGKAHAEPLAVAQQAAELRQILRRGDHQDVADAGQHQGGQRVIHHRLVVHGQQLLGRRQRHRMQPRAGATGQQDTLHAAVPNRWPAYRPARTDFHQSRCARYHSTVRASPVSKSWGAVHASAASVREGSIS